jgi:type II secretory ATPase GspE/PulE/Tfp pilus assembly ATPase PilB-like protein
VIALAEAPDLAVPTESDEIVHARALADRYRAEYIDLENFPIQQDVMRSVPVDMMFRFNFVPLEQHEGSLVIAVADPSRLMVLDEIADLLGKRIIPRVATLSQITDLLKKTEQSQRVLDEATKGLAPDAPSTDPTDSDENISIEILTSDKDSDPIVRLLDTIIFAALDRRASDPTSL